MLSLLLAMAACACAHAKQPDAPTASATLHDTRITVELATNAASREHGLMGRTRLASDHGMLFVFPDTQPRWFWMKNTLIPLDILYFDGHRKLVSMQLDVPPCKADPCATYPSDMPARYVLELAAGEARHIDARVGDVLAIDADLGAVR
jgi:hypothetical protein